MTLGSPLASASANLYHPIGVQGQPIFAAHVQLRAALLQRFGQRHANCFSRPDQDSRDETIRWHAEIPGLARRWTELSPLEQALAALTLEEIRGDLAAYARTLREQTTDGSAHTIALMLEQAVIIPSPDHLHLIGDQPVLSFWGFERTKGQGIDGLGLAPSAEAPAVPYHSGEPSAPPEAAGEAPVRRGGFWAWLAILPLLLLLLLLLAWLFWGYGCTPSVEIGAGGGLPPLVELPRADGTPPQVASPVLPSVQAPPTAGVTALPPGAVERSAIPAPGVNSDGVPSPSGAEKSSLTENPPAASAMPSETPAPLNPPPPPIVPKNPLQIPPEALQKGDPSFLAGRWQSRRGVIDDKTGEPLVQQYRFDQQGRGEAIIRRTDGSECRSPAQGTISGGKLSVQEQGPITCPDGRTYRRAETQCERTASGITVCRGKNADGSDYRVDLDRLP